MLIGGLQKFTALDYPEKIAATLFTVGCNFRCPYCHNVELVEISMFDRKNLLSEEYILSFLDSRRSDLDGVCITGGEPTLQSDLVEFAGKIKEMGFMLKLDTNGSNPKVVEELLRKNLVDYFAIDIKTSFDKYERVEARILGDAVIETICLINDHKTCLELRTTAVPGVVDQNDIEKVIDFLNEKNPLILKNLYRYSIQGFRPQRTLREEYLTVTPYEEHILVSMAELVKKYCSRVDILN